MPLNWRSISRCLLSSTACFDSSGAAGIGGGGEFAHAKELLFQPLEGLADCSWSVESFSGEAGSAFAAALSLLPAGGSRLPGADRPARNGRKHRNQPAEAGHGDEMSRDGHVYFSNNSRIRLSCRVLGLFVHLLLLLDNVAKPLHNLVVV